jgi:hypothetical protein
MNGKFDGGMATGNDISEGRSRPTGLAAEVITDNHPP